MSNTPEFDTIRRHNLDRLYQRKEEWSQYATRDLNQGHEIIEQAYEHTTDNGTAILVPGVNVMEDEARHLEARGAVFPLQIAEPLRATFFNEQGEVVFHAKVKAFEQEVFDGRGNVIGHNISTKKPNEVIGY